MTEPITQAELDELKAIEAAGTPGPWVVQVEDNKTMYVGPEVGRTDPYDGDLPIVEPILQKGRRVSLKDCYLAAEARNALPRLLAEVEVLRALLLEYTFSPVDSQGGHCVSCGAWNGDSLKAFGDPEPHTKYCEIARILDLSRKS